MGQKTLETQKAEAVNPRRLFLYQSACAGYLMAGCSGGGGAGSPAAVGQVDAGLLSDYPINSLQAVGRKPVAVGRDKDGLYALTLTCTHEGCNMATQGSVAATRIVCNCHGAQFDGNGEVLAGPAQASLAHFAVIYDATTQQVTIDGDTEVAPETRTAVA
jgi:Rieske Fe-S protein